MNYGKPVFPGKPRSTPCVGVGPIDRALTPLWPEVEVIEPDEGIIADVEA